MTYFNPNAKPQPRCRPHLIAVNEKEVDGPGSERYWQFPCYGGSWDVLHAATTTLSLAEGLNTVQLEKVGTDPDSLGDVQVVLDPALPSDDAFGLYEINGREWVNMRTIVYISDSSVDLAGKFAFKFHACHSQPARLAGPDRDRELPG